MNTYFVLARILMLATTIAIVIVLNKRFSSLQSTHRNDTGFRKKIKFISGAIWIWLALLLVLNTNHFFSNYEVFPPRVFFALIVPVLTGVYLLFDRTFSHKLLTTCQAKWLIGIQSFRIPVEVALWLAFISGVIPFQMTFAGLNYDVIVGITAIPAMFLFTKVKSKSQIILWNIFGILLLANIVYISLISTPGPFRIFMNEPANTLFTFIPFIWLPGFLVPFALITHLLSIKQALLFNNEF